MINVGEHDNTRPAETNPIGDNAKRGGEASEVGVVLRVAFTRGDRRVPARVTRRRSPPVIVPAASSLRSSADGQACSAKIAGFAAVFPEGTARCWWSPPSPPGYWRLRRPEFRALPPRCHACGRPASVSTAGAWPVRAAEHRRLIPGRMLVGRIACSCGQTHHLAMRLRRRHLRSTMQLARRASARPPANLPRVTACTDAS